MLSRRCFGGEMSRFVWVLALALSACAAGGDWAKDGATEEELARDLAVCRDQAASVTGRDRRIDQDIRASRAGSSLSTNFGTFRDEVRDVRFEQRFDDLVESCMRGRGYARAGETL